MATGTVEEKIFQRQLSKEGLQSVVDDKQQVNELSSKDLKNLFKVS
jgi:DNA repair and recombination protein RAD54 and RAD54-like protein